MIDNDVLFMQICVSFTPSKKFFFPPLTTEYFPTSLWDHQDIYFKKHEITLWIIFD